MRTLEEMRGQAQAGKGSFVVSSAEWLVLLNAHEVEFTGVENVPTFEGRQVVVK